LPLSAANRFSFECHALNPTSPTVLELRQVFKLITLAHKSPVTDTSKANKQYPEIVRLHLMSDDGESDE
jgi:hypothetical protein